MDDKEPDYLGWHSEKYLIAAVVFVVVDNSGDVDAGCLIDVFIIIGGGVSCCLGGGVGGGVGGGSSGVFVFACGDCCW